MFITMFITYNVFSIMCRTKYESDIKNDFAYQDIVRFKPLLQNETLDAITMICIIPRGSTDRGSIIYHTVHGLRSVIIYLV